jgi:hypothetical protein
MTKTGKIKKKMSPSSIVRERRKLKKLKGLLEKGRITFLEIKNQFKSWMGTLKRYNCYNSTQNMVVLFNTLFSTERGCAV